MPQINEDLFNRVLTIVDYSDADVNKAVFLELQSLLDQPEVEPVATVPNKYDYKRILQNAQGYLSAKTVTPLCTYPLASIESSTDWFYKLNFICRVLEGNAPVRDMLTALGMARSLFNEKHSEGMAAPRKPITAADVTDEMVLTYYKDFPYLADKPSVIQAAKGDIAAAYNVVNAYLPNLEKL